MPPSTISRWPTRPAWRRRVWPSPTIRPRRTTIRSRAGRHRPAGRQTGHGGQMHAFQALLRNQRLRHRDRYDRSGGVHRRRQANRPHLRRDQSRRHKSSRMFRDRTAARRGAGHSGHARRPARNGDHRLGSAHQRDVPERETRRSSSTAPVRPPSPVQGCSSRSARAATRSRCATAGA